MPESLRSRDAVLRACAEYDELGRDPFLERYGYGRSRRYLLRVDGRDYDSKAIVGVAYGYEHPGEGTLPHSAFSGGIGPSGAARQLRDLGFDIVALT